MQKIKLHMLEKYNYFENIFLQGWSLDDEGSHEKESAWFELPDGFEIAAGKDGLKRVYDLRTGESIPCELLTDRGVPRLVSCSGCTTLRRTVEDTEAAELRKIREKAGLNRSEFSDATSIPLRTLEDWESGKRKPPFYVIRLLEFFVDHLDA